MATKEEIFKIGENYKSEQLEAQSRAAIIAHLTDPSVQLEFTNKSHDCWNLKKDLTRFNLEYYHYRIAKPRKWYRVGKFKDGTPFTVYTKGEEHWQSQPNFEKWLDERKYYD